MDSTAIAFLMDILEEIILEVVMHIKTQVEALG